MLFDGAAFFFFLCHDVCPFVCVPLPGCCGWLPCIQWRLLGPTQLTVVLLWVPKGGKRDSGQHVCMLNEKNWRVIHSKMGSVLAVFVDRRGHSQCLFPRLPAACVVDQSRLQGGQPEQSPRSTPANEHASLATARVPAARAEFLFGPPPTKATPSVRERRGILVTSVAFCSGHPPTSTHRPPEHNTCCL